jgi:hypothetical protein
MLLISYLLLVFVCVCGLCGLFIFNDYVKKIASLSVAYSSLITLILIIAYENKILNDLLYFFISVLLIFSINLMIGIGIIKNIGEVVNNNKL